MKRAIFLALLSAALIALPGCGGGPDATPEAPARDVLAEGLAAANDAGRPLLIDVYADW